MEIEIFTLCDYSKIVDNKLSIIDCFNIIESKELPFKRINIFIVGRINFESNELGKYDFRIEIINPLKEKILECHIEEIKIRIINAVIPPYNFIKQINEINFNHFGKYRVSLLMNGRRIKDSILYITPTI